MRSLVVNMVGMVGVCVFVGGVFSWVVWFGGCGVCVCVACEE